MEELTHHVWRQQDRHAGDRSRLLQAVGEFIGNTPVLYPGSFADIAASFHFDSVTYVDSDRRAARFFADRDGVDSIIAAHRLRRTRAEWRFVAADYRDFIGVTEKSVGLLVSLYAGFVSAHCTRYLVEGGWLLVNPSHGDVAMTSLNAEYTLAAVIKSRSGRYAITCTDLDGYLIPKKPATITAEQLQATGRGIAYTRSPFAYLFRRTKV